MTGIVWLASYPRSGNTWMRLALWTLKNGRPAELDEIGRFGHMAIRRSLFDHMLEADSGVLTPREIEALRPDLHRAMREHGPPPLVKVHDAWRLTHDGRPVHAAEVTHAVVYLIRDPRDVAVSWASFRGRPLDWAVDYLADRNAVIGGEPSGIQTQTPQHIGSWSNNVTSWIDDSGLAPLVIRYEDLLTDTARHIRAISDHLGWPATDQIVDMAVEATRFERLAGMERQSGFSERPASTDRFFRVGRAEGWRDVLSAAQVARIERAHGAIMARFGYL